jgi:hypothetical protein
MENIYQKGPAYKPTPSGPVKLLLFLTCLIVN